jgi:ferrous-iron efflux pump FieF
MDRARLLRRVTNAAVAVAATLAVVKFVAYWASGSLAVLASAIDSALDACASLLNAVAVRYALKPADAEHRFGHGKSEALAGLAQCCLICGSAVFVIWHAVERLLQPQPVAALAVSFAVMCFSLALTLGLVAYQRRVIRLTGSTAVRGDALHYLSDVASNATAILAVLLARFGMHGADPWLGIVIALVTLYGALQVGREGFQMLMDRELSTDVQARIREIALAHRQVLGLHGLRTRQSGQTPLIQFHLELDPTLSLIEANRVAHEVSLALDREFPGADVLVHQDPAGHAGHPKPLVSDSSY